MCRDGVLGEAARKRVVWWRWGVGLRLDFPSGPAGASVYKSTGDGVGGWAFEDRSVSSSLASFPMGAAERISIGRGGD